VGTVAKAVGMAPTSEYRATVTTANRGELGAGESLMAAVGTISGSSNAYGLSGGGCGCAGCQQSGTSSNNNIHIQSGYPKRERGEKQEKISLGILFLGWCIVDLILVL